MAARDKPEAQPYAADPEGAQTSCLPCQTEGKRAERELEEQWRAAFEANPTMYFIVDQAGAIVSVNPVGAQQLGYAVNELVGQPVLNVFYEPDRAFVQKKVESCFSNLGRTVRWEARKLRKDGEMLWVRETANAVMLRSRAVLLVACEDVTEQKRVEEALRESEERFRTLVQFSFDVYWESDAQHRFVRQEFDQTLRDAPAPGSELGKTRWEVPYLEPDEEAWRRHRETLDAHLPFRDFELARPTPDGRKRYVSVSGLPVFDAVGTFVGYRGVGRDITERKRAEETLRQREKELRDIIETMPAMAFVTDASGRIAIGNRRWLEYTGLGPDAANSKVAVHPEDAPRYTAARSHSIATGEPFEQEVRLRRFDGEYRWFLGRAVALRDEQGNVLKWYGVHTDIHDWKLAEEERAAYIRSLRESERKLEEAQRIGRMGYVEYDVGNQRLTLSDEACRIYGIEQHQLSSWQGRALELVHAQDRARLVEAIGAAGKGDGRFDVEFRAVRPDGEVRFVHSRGEAMRDVSGGRLRAFGTLQDITELRHAQEELSASEQLTRHIFESAPDGMAVIGRDYRYRRVNPVHEHSWKMHADEIIGLHVRDLHGSEVFEQILKPAMDRCFAGEQVSFADWFVNARGRFYYSVIYTPVRLGSEQVEAALAITRDLTDHMLASQALRDAEAALARVNRVTTLGVLAASIAHEVNQPLGAITASAAACTRWLAAQPPEMEKARSALQRIVADGRRAGQVVDRIRALVNRQAPRRSCVDVNEAILEVIALTRDEVRRNAITLDTSLAPDLPPVEGDRVQLQQVALNLLVNAIEAMKGGGARPRELAIGSARDDANTVTVEVRDSGPGVDPEHVDRLFEAFYSTKEDGIGMGLSISRSIIEAHGGRLWVTPNVPHGAAFRFSLPALQPVS